jgi:CheY-like chemotaxis protein
MGGAIGVDSAPGQGATFWFEVVLPGEERQADGARVGHPAPAQAARPAAPGKGWRVLLAEDNATNQKVATLMLSALGCQVELAPSGRHAVEAWRASAFDLILMDCQMPDMDGFEATRTIRSGERAGARTPIVAVTANAMAGDRERCLAAGMDDYVTKPLTKAGLGGALDRLIERGLLEERRQAVATPAARA